VTARMLDPILEEPPLTKLLLTPEEAAQVLGIGRTKVYELMLSNALESVKIGASRRIPVQSLSTFVDRLRAQGA
jgi:excisionase family DNA binding protein